VLRGMYRIRSTGNPGVRLLAAGTILREALAAADLLQTEFGVAADVYSVTSFTELRREAMEQERQDRTDTEPSWLENQLPLNGTPVVAVSDYVSAVPDLIRAWIGDRYFTLGTDGFGRSDTRAALREFFGVDRRSIALAALKATNSDRTSEAITRWQLCSSNTPVAPA